jgi:formylglycine-generating enzyme required for sulfatase activity
MTVSLAGPSFAQVLCGVPTRGPASAAVAALEQIETAVGFEHGTIQLFVSSDQMVRDRSGAVSVQCPVGNALQRWIVFDPDLIKGDSLYFALAHETAHHLNNDPMSGEAPSKQQELSADGLAARYLARPPLNWTSQKLVEALNSLPLPKDARGGYPSLEERRAKVTESYQTESARFTQPAPEPPPVKPAPVASPSQSTLTAGSKRTNPKDGLTYVWIPSGSFTMGCSPGDDECQPTETEPHEVTITKGFWIGQHEVTQQVYRKVIGTNPSHFKGDKLPVEDTSWNEAYTYCRAIGGRLPTEAEWEYAARAGTSGSRYGDLDRIAWYNKNSGNKTHEVAQKDPNAWGLYDTLGNVNEWTADLPDKDATPSAATPDPKSALSIGKTFRGGSYSSGFLGVGVPRASSRSFFIVPLLPYSDIGVRCVADLPSESAR